MKKLRVGIIGAGDIVTRFHLNPGWSSVPDCEVVAICDINENLVKRVAETFAIPHTFTDFNELVKMDLDCIQVCTPNKIHTPAVIAALNAGKHVLCEKPLAVSVEEVKQIAEAAKANNRLLATAQFKRFTDKAIAVKRMIEAGGAGDFYHVRVHATRRNWLPVARTFIDPALSGGGPCMDIGVHALDLALYLMDFPKPVRATGRFAVNFAKGNAIPGAWGEWDRNAFGVEDYACGFVFFENGCTLTLESSWLQHQKETEDMSIALFGRKGTIHWPSGEYHSAANGVLIDATATPAVSSGKPRADEIVAFARAVREGLPSPVPVEQTLSVIAILEAIQKSGELGKEIAISL